MYYTLEVKLGNSGFVVIYKGRMEREFSVAMDFFFVEMSPGKQILSEIILDLRSLRGVLM